jgi:hypothetical protein
MVEEDDHCVEPVLEAEEASKSLEQQEHQAQEPRSVRATVTYPRAEARAILLMAPDVIRPSSDVIRPSS